jgi:hypothetical protein
MSEIHFAREAKKSIDKKDDMKKIVLSGTRAGDERRRENIKEILV